MVVWLPVTHVTPNICQKICVPSYLSDCLLARILRIWLNNNINNILDVGPRGPRAVAPAALPHEPALPTKHVPDAGPKWYPSLEISHLWFVKDYIHHLYHSFQIQVRSNMCVPCLKYNITLCFRAPLISVRHRLISNNMWFSFSGRFISPLLHIFRKLKLMCMYTFFQKITIIRWYFSAYITNRR